MLVFLPLSIPALSTVHMPRLCTLPLKEALVGGRMPTRRPRRPGRHGNSHSASVSLCHSWRYTVLRERKIKKLETNQMRKADKK